jgi:hypothetical protein
MAEVFSKNYSNDDYEYRYTVEWDEVAFGEEENLGFSFKVERKPFGADDSEYVAIEASIETKKTDAGMVAVISVGGEQIAEVNLEAFFPTSSAAELFVEAIPAHFFGGDPFIGCLIRSGLASVLGQIIECRNMTTDREGFFYRARALAGCVAEHSKDIGIKIGKRTVACALRFGL